MKTYRLISEEDHEHSLFKLMSIKDDLIDILLQAKDEMQNYHGEEIQSSSGKYTKYIDFGCILTDLTSVLEFAQLSTQCHTKPRGMNIVLESIMIENLALKEKNLALEEKVKDTRNNLHSELYKAISSYTRYDESNDNYEFNILKR